MDERSCAVPFDHSQYVDSQKTVLGYRVFGRRELHRARVLSSGSSKGRDASDVRPVFFNKYDEHCHLTGRVDMHRRHELSVEK